MTLSCMVTVLSCRVDFLFRLPWSHHKLCLARQNSHKTRTSHKTRHPQEKTKQDTGLSRLVLWWPSACFSRLIDPDYRDMIANATCSSRLCTSFDLDYLGDNIKGKTPTTQDKTQNTKQNKSSTRHQDKLIPVPLQAGYVQLLGKDTNFGILGF